MKFLQSSLFLLLSNIIISTLACRSMKLLASGITETDKQEILQTHNTMRQWVALGQVQGQPAAENMVEMVWDEQLAQIAQQWADNCDFEHTPDRDIPGRWEYGQNLGRQRSTAAPPAIDSNEFIPRIYDWYNEVHQYRFSDIFNVQTGHYTQLVWAETNLIGCGFSLAKQGRLFVRLYVCNYGPGGNVEGEYPYKVGQPTCSKFSLKPSQNYNGLCQAEGGQFVDSNSIATNHDQQAYDQHIQYVDQQINRQQQEVAERREIVQKSPPNSGFHTYQWNNVFNRFFKTYDPNLFGKK